MLEYIFLGAIAIFLVFVITRFRPARTANIADNLYAVNCMFVNFYAYNVGGKIMLFDTGVNAAVARNGLKKLGLSPEKVTHIFLTHTDYDHAGGITAFPNAEVYISCEEEQMINGQTARRGIMRNRRLPSYKTLKDSEAVVLGDSCVKIIFTPGHTPGSSSYLIDNRILITGDLLRLTRSGSVKPFLWLMNKDHKGDIQSVQAMRGVIENADYVLTGHSGVKIVSLKS